MLFEKDGTRGRFPDWETQAGFPPKRVNRPSERWLECCGFKSIRLANLADTTTAEQRSTDWMTFDSLETFLDPNDPSKTIEGYPGPRRALFVAEVQM
ncbi:MAG: DUF1698 domain-containing protein [Opitutales bacterium]|nr:DUF1698 domain-containing protein [Opitutales bacterium]